MKIKIYGVGNTTNSIIKNKLGLNNRKEFSQIKVQNKVKIKNYLSNSFLKNRTKETEKNNISFLIKLRSFKGLRHKLKYPTRGQRTHTNAKTRKKARN